MDGMTSVSPSSVIESLTPHVNDDEAIETAEPTLHAFGNKTVQDSEASLGPCVIELRDCVLTFPRGLGARHSWIL